MTKFKIKASAEEVAKAGQDQGEFEVPKPGFYHVKLVEANAGYSKGADGEEDQDKPRIECVYEIIGEGIECAATDKNYGRLWDYVTFGDGYAATRRVEFAQAFDPSLSTADIIAGKVELDTDELVERVVVARIKQEKDKQKTEEARAADRKAPAVFRARIAMLIAPESIDQYTEAEHSTAAFGSAADTEGDPFGDAPADEQGAAVELLTEEELSGYEPKELGATAKEFDLDPAQFLVKVRGKVDLPKSKAALIAAILEAQGTDDIPDAEAIAEDSDNPF